MRHNASPACPSACCSQAWREERQEKSMHFRSSRYPKSCWGDCPSSALVVLYHVFLPLWKSPTLVLSCVPLTIITPKASDFYSCQGYKNTCPRASHLHWSACQLMEESLSHNPAIQSVPCSSLHWHKAQVLHQEWKAPGISRHLEWVPVVLSCGQWWALPGRRLSAVGICSSCSASPCRVISQAAGAAGSSGLRQLRTQSSEEQSFTFRYQQWHAQWRWVQKRVLSPGTWRFAGSLVALWSPFPNVCITN